MENTKLVEDSKLEFVCKELNLNIKTILKQYTKHHEYITRIFHDLYDKWFKDYCKAPVCWQEENAVLDDMYILFDKFNQMIDERIPDCELDILFKNCSDMLFLGDIIEDLENLSINQ